jgi:hypothetical protein
VIHGIFAADHAPILPAKIHFGPGFQPEFGCLARHSVRIENFFCICKAPLRAVVEACVDEAFSAGEGLTLPFNPYFRRLKRNRISAGLPFETDVSKSFTEKCKSMCSVENIHHEDAETNTNIR